MNSKSKIFHRTRSTLHDVAELAGVSSTTVSLVLDGKGVKRRISEDTHGKVQRAALALGYTPSLLHRSMRRGRTHVLSLYNAFRNREWSDLYMDRLSAAVEHAGGSRGYDVLVHCNFERDTKATYEFLNGGLSDGLILFGPASDEPLIPLLRESNLPTVLIDPRNPDSGLSSVYDDEATGMRLIAETLVEHGHTLIAAVVEKFGGVLDPMRRLGRLQTELRILGIELTDQQILLWDGSAGNALSQVLAMNPRPTAIFVWHDRAAYRITEACAEAGIRVPDDLSIVGYDGLVWPSSTGHVVSSVLVELDRVGTAAVNLLDRLIEGELGPLTETVSVSFLTGSTLGSVNASPVHSKEG